MMIIMKIIMKMNRKLIPQKEIEKSNREIMKKLYKRLEQKGWGTFSSKHEILGIITEEYKELIDAVHSKDNKNIEEELMDIAVGAILGLSCLKSNLLDW